MVSYCIQRFRRSLPSYTSYRIKTYVKYFSIFISGAAMIKLILLAALACVTVSRADLIDLAVLLDINIGGGGCQDVDAIDRTLRDVSKTPSNCLLY